MCLIQPPCTIFQKHSPKCCGTGPAAVTLPGAGRPGREALTGPSITSLSCSLRQGPADKADSGPRPRSVPVTASGSRPRGSWCNHPTLPWKPLLYADTNSVLLLHCCGVWPCVLGIYHRYACCKPAEGQTPSSFEEIVLLNSPFEGSSWTSLGPAACWVFSVP